MSEVQFSIFEQKLKFTYRWNLTDLAKVEKHGTTVFSCFACGGGSTMGYKMSGFNVLGCNEIDPEMIQVYKQNHNPKHAFLESIETFKLRDDLPKELYELDILDGSPPCSSFSTAGKRDKDWGKDKKFREGQAKQILDDLFFHYIDLAKKLQPKVVVAENVKGMLVGKAKGYVKEVIAGFKDAGYDVQLFLLNGASMGLPQRRERVFFICKRKDLDFPKLELDFNEKPITIRQAFGDCFDDKGRDRSDSKNFAVWMKTKPGKNLASVHHKGSLFNHIKLDPDKPSPTLAASSASSMFRWDTMNQLTNKQFCLLGSYPLDYKFKKENLAPYQIGMSVPPLMMHKISEQIYDQWFRK